MIHKIERLNSIGKFRNYQATGDVAFKKLTLFYADNGSGKTTLTAILRSLTQNRPEIIRRRQSTNLAIPQTAKIIARTASGDTHHTFNASGWTVSLPDMEIFDIHFVNDNVYSGFDFNDEHKRQLHQFVIGGQGVAIQQRIEQNKSGKTTSRQNLASIEQQLIQQVANNLTSDQITSFLAIRPAQANGIDQLILTAEATLANANANSVIQSLPSLARLTAINSNINFANLAGDLLTTNQIIQDAALQSLFESHCEDLLHYQIPGPENWLRLGVNYIESKQFDKKDDKQSPLPCPFCKQSIDNTIDIIQAYTLRFNTEFNSLVQRIQDHLTVLQAFNLEATIQGIINFCENNATRINSWMAHLPGTVQQPIFHIIPDIDELRAVYQEVISIFQQKSQNPSIALQTDSLIKFRDSLETINRNIAKHNEEIAQFNAAISSFKSSIQTVQQAQTEVNRLKRIKARFEAPIAQLCNDITTVKQNIKVLESAYAQLVQQQEQAATTFFSTYKNRINHYLGTIFKTLFRIEDVVHVPPQGRSTQSKISYKLTIDGQDISFDSTQQNNVKDCLSEGDKSTIALAFFLSKLDIDPNKQDKILVFDDPLSSFDSNRRLYTVQLINNLLPLIKQIIVLSHNEYFLHQVYKNVSAADKKALRITENFVAKASTIEPLDLERLVENDYFKHVKELEDFLTNADINKKDTVLGWMRNVLEAHIRFKFYRQTLNIAPNNRTLGTLISTLENKAVPFRDNVNRIEILQSLRLINAISCKPHHGEPLPDYGAIGVDPSTIVVSELVQFVQDTLDLIDNKL